MDELSKLLDEVNTLTNLPSSKQRALEACERAVQEATNAKLYARLGELGEKAAAATQEFEAALDNSRKKLPKLYLSFAEIANKERKRGVPYPEFEWRNWSSLGNATVEEVTEIGAGLRQRIEGLRQAIEQHDQLLQRLSRAFQELNQQYERLWDYELIKGDDTAIRDKLAEQQQTSIQISQLEALIRDVQNVTYTFKQRVDAEVEQKIVEAQQNMERLWQAIGLLQAQLEDQRLEKNQLTARLKLNQEREQLLAALIGFGGHLQAHRTSTAQSKLLEIQQLRDQLAALQNELHPASIEAVQIAHVLTVEPSSLLDEQILPYLTQLAETIAAAQLSGPNALRQYKEKLAHSPDYVFGTLVEVEQLGKALVDLAGEPERYAGPLWHEALDVFTRAALSEVTGWESEAFYRQFGYPMLRNALEAAIQNGDFCRALGFICVEKVGFLPEGNDSKQNILTVVLTHPMLQATLAHARQLDALRAKPEHFALLSAEQRQAMLLFMEVASDELLPPLIRLQWAAGLLQTASGASHIERGHHLADQAFIDALLRNERYIAAYYALTVLGDAYPNLWQHAAVSQMFIVLTKTAFDQFQTGFLLELCLHPQLAQWAEKDFDILVLQACLAFYLWLDKSGTELELQAWAAWDKLAAQYPKLAEVIQVLLSGDAFATVSREQLRQNYQQQLAQLKQSLENTPEFDGVRQAERIYRWYLDFVRNWLERLPPVEVGPKDISAANKKLQALVREIEERRAPDDLVNACPHQKDLPNPDLKPIYEYGYLKRQLNRKISGLLDGIWQCVQMQCELTMPMDKRRVLPKAALQVELANLKRTTHAWGVVESLFLPKLPEANEWLNL